MLPFGWLSFFGRPLWTSNYGVFPGMMGCRTPSKRLQFGHQTCSSLSRRHNGMGRWEPRVESDDEVSSSSANGANCLRRYSCCGLCLQSHPFAKRPMAPALFCSLRDPGGYDEVCARYRGYVRSLCPFPSPPSHLPDNPDRL